MKPRYLVIALLFAPCLALAEAGTALKDDTLRMEPYADAKSSGVLKRSDKVDILEKKGAWLKVKAPKGSGWVRLLSVKRGEAGKSNEAAGVLSVASGRAGTGQVVSTTGVRGLNEEELKSAKFNEEEVKKLEANSISAEQAKQFAEAGSLKPQKLAYLPTPKSGKGSGK
ncbi:MAG TPA: SH3 domain-containing protein [Methylophilaceae bacterium]|nr:SH3 domain-containing protein [Methylophilaceae bacterium]